MSIAFLVLKLEGGQIDPPGVTGSRNSPVGIGLNVKTRKTLTTNGMCLKA